MKQILITLLFISPLPFFAFSAGERELTVYYSVSLNGNLEGCDCNGAPVAGLVKRAAFLQELSGEEEFILVDGGDIFDAREDALLSDYIIEVYKKYGYDAVGVGDQEFSNGTGYLRQKLGSFPFS